MVRQTVAPIFVLSMAVAAAILTGSGFTAEAGVGYDVGLSDSADDLRELADQDVEGSVVQDAVNLIGLAIAAIDIIVQTFVWVFLFPLALINIGFPAWFAVPVGLPVLYINVIGTVSILRGMNVR
jgi:hypothetical protein